MYSRVWQHALSLLLPSICLSCERDLPLATDPPALGLCAQCHRSVVWRKGVDFPDGDWLDGFFAAAEFSGAMRDCVHSFKYHRRDVLAKGLAQHWIDLSPIDAEEYDVVVPVPLAPLKSLVRGYNPAEVFAARLADAHKRPLHRVLSRCLLSRTQTDKNRDDRRANASRAFYVWRFGHVALQGKRVLLVDDVCTTGATLQSCARLLKLAGAGRVIGAAIARDMLA